MSAPAPREQRSTELGLEVQCARCREFWPADLEFFYFSGGKPHSWCKACYRADEKMQAKVERWKGKQRKGEPPRQAAPDYAWQPLLQLLHGAPEGAH